MHEADEAAVHAGGGGEGLISALHARGTCVEILTTTRAAFWQSRHNFYRNSESMLYKRATHISRRQHGTVVDWSQRSEDI